MQRVGSILLSPDGPTSPDEMPFRREKRQPVQLPAEEAPFAMPEEPGPSPTVRWAGAGAVVRPLSTGAGAVQGARYGAPLTVLLSEPQLITGERVRNDGRDAAAVAANRSARSLDLVGWLDDRRILMVQECKGVGKLVSPVNDGFLF